MKKGRKTKFIWIIGLPVAVILLAAFLVLYMKSANVSKIPIPEIVSAQGIDEQQVVVKWKTDDAAAGYVLLRRLPEEEEWTSVAEIEDPKADSYTDSEVQPGTVYYYSVKAFEKKDEKYKYSKFDTVGTAVLSGLEVPMLYSVEAVDDHQVEMKWVPVENATGYCIYRQPEDGEEEEIAELTTAEADSYMDRSEKENLNYIYSMRAYVEKPDMNRVWSAYASGFTVLAGVEVPEMKAVDRLGENWAKVQWEPVEGVDGYCVYKQENNEWVERGNVSECSWIDEAVSQKKNVYCVKAYKEAGSRTVYSDFSDSMEAGKLDQSEEAQAKVDYWVGDSRTVYMGEYLGIYTKCYGMVGAKYDWYSGIADAWVRLILDNQPDASIVLNCGVNDVDNADEAIENYINSYKKLVQDYPKATIWFMSINPTDEKYSWAEVWGITSQDMIEYVNRFNARLQKEFPDRFIDTNTYLTKTGFETLDGLHYTVETTEKIYWYALSCIEAYTRGE